MYEDCDVGIQQTLPAGVFAGEDEMKEHSCKNSVSFVSLLHKKIFPLAELLIQKWEFLLVLTILTF